MPRINICEKPRKPKQSNASRSAPSSAPSHVPMQNQTMEAQALSQIQSQVQAQAQNRTQVRVPNRAQNRGQAPSTNLVAGQRTVKGCCCKRSQCIKNYCDCYQSMVICSKFCRCVGCRNTEVRKSLDSMTPAKNANAAKRDKAAAMTAKAAAAAAKAGITVAVKQLAGSVALTPAQMAGAVSLSLAPQAPAGMEQQSTSQQAMQLASGGREGLVAARPSPDGKSTKTLKPSGQVPSAPAAKPLPRQQPSFFTQPVNASLLECMLTQATEAEQLGLTEVQVSQMVLQEFCRGAKAVYEATCEHTEITFAK